MCCAVIKTSEFFETSEVFFLHQHPHQIFQELGFFCPIADPVVNGDGGFHASAGSLFLL